MVLEDEFSNTLTSIKEEKNYVNNVPTFNTKSLNKDIKNEFLKSKTIEINKSIKFNKSNNDMIADVVENNGDDNFFNMNDQFTLDESTGQEYYSYLEFTVSYNGYV